VPTDLGAISGTSTLAHAASAKTHRAYIETEVVKGCNAKVIYQGLVEHRKKATMTSVLVHLVATADARANGGSLSRRSRATKAADCNCPELRQRKALSDGGGGLGEAGPRRGDMSYVDSKNAEPRRCYETPGFGPLTTEVASSGARARVSLRRPAEFQGAGFGIGMPLF
jgi:hypothetical protein